MWNAVMAIVFLLLACPLIVGGPLIIYVVATTWRRLSLKKRLVKSFVLATLALVSVNGLVFISEFWIVRLYIMGVFWLMNAPVIALVFVLRRSDRLVQAAMPSQAGGSTSIRGNGSDSCRNDDSRPL